MTREDAIKAMEFLVKLAIKRDEYKLIKIAKIYAKQINIEFETNKDRTIINGKSFEHNGKFDYLF